MTPEQQELFNELPTSGELQYETWSNNLRTAGKEKLLRHFHKLRRSGAIAIRLEQGDNGLTMHVKRGTV